VSSLYHLKDSENDNRDAGFFVFPDLSVRQEGSYRLKLSLFEVVGCVYFFLLSIVFCLSLSSHPYLLPLPILRALSPISHHVTTHFLSPSAGRVPPVQFRSCLVRSSRGFCPFKHDACSSFPLSDCLWQQMGSLRSQIKCLSLQVNILKSFLCVHRKEISGDGRFASL
jgi:hypothetical protein